MESKSAKSGSFKDFLAEAVKRPRVGPPTTVAGKIRGAFPQLLENPTGRKILGGTAAGLSAAALMAVLRELRREGDLDQILGPTSKPGQGSLVVSVPRKKKEDEKQSAFKLTDSDSLNTALGIIASALAAGGAYKGYTALDDLRVDRTLKKKEDEAKKKFLRAVQSKKFANEVDDLVKLSSLILDTGEKKAGPTADNVKTVLWLLGLGLTGGSMFATKRFADAQYGVDSMPAIPPKERKVVFKSYDPDEVDDTKEAESMELSDSDLKVAMLAYRFALKPKPEKGDAGFKEAEAGLDTEDYIKQAQIDWRGLLNTTAESARKVPLVGDAVASGLDKVRNYGTGRIVNSPDFVDQMTDLDSKLMVDAAEDYPVLQNPLAKWMLGTNAGKSYLRDQALQRQQYFKEHGTLDGFQQPGLISAILSILGKGASNVFGNIKDWFSNLGNKQPGDQTVTQTAAGNTTNTAPTPPVTAPPATGAPEYGIRATSALDRLGVNQTPYYVDFSKTDSKPTPGSSADVMSKNLGDFMGTNQPTTGQTNDFFSEES